MRGEPMLPHKTLFFPFLGWLFSFPDHFINKKDKNRTKKKKKRNKLGASYSSDGTSA